MYKILLATRLGQMISALILSMVPRMMQLSDQGQSALVALMDKLPADLPNCYKRLAGYLVRCVMRENDYTLVPGSRCRFTGPSLFKTGARYRAVGHAHALPWV